jgi:hypothetical protein
MKIADWVRATNGVVKNMRSAIQDIRNAKASVEDIISVAKSMKDFNLYDMDSWAVTVDNAKLIAGHHTNEVLRHIGNFESHAIRGVTDYISALEDIENFDIREEKNKKRRLIIREFSPESDESYLDAVLDDMKTENDKYKLLEAAKTKLIMQKDNIERLLSSTYYMPEREALEDSVRHINYRIRRIEKKIIIRKNIAEGKDYVMKSDTIISDAKELMAVNMTEAEMIYSLIYKFDEQAAEIVDNISRLANNNVPGKAKNNVLPSPVDITSSDFARAQKDGANIYGDHPNQAPVPEASGQSNDYGFGEMDKKDVNTQDIIQTRNQINLILLRQEKFLLDINAMKANSMAYMILIDGYNRSAKLARYDALKVHSINFAEKASKLAEEAK